jgi:flagellar biosynthesis protein FlhF
MGDMNSGMKLETFRGKTMAEALQQVKTALGQEAVILHTRTLQTRFCLGLRRRELFEITAGRGLNVSRGNRRITKAKPENEQRPLGASAAGITYGPGAAKAPAPRPVAQLQQLQPASQATTLTEMTAKLLDTPAASKAIIQSVNQEMAQIKKMVQELVDDTRKAQCPKVPEELFNHYLQLIQNEVAEELAQDIMASLKRELRPEYLTQERYVRDRIAEHIEKLIPSSGPIIRKSTSGPHVLALIGPTGVGKTTTLAKLAANLKLKDHYTVGLITLDTYRIAAVEQLRRYAELIRAPLRVVATTEELSDALASMSSLDFVLIDTAGRSPNDMLKLSELRELLATVQPDEVHLVLSSTSGQSCVELAVQRFSEVRVDKIIFTKLDEAAHVGLVLNVVKKLNKTLSYVTTGQDVPNDIEVGRGRTLARMILGPEST